MSYRDFITKHVPASIENYTAGRTADILGIVIHHGATTSLDAIGRTFQAPGRQASAHFGIDGNEVHQFVDVNDTAWHCGNWYGNCRTIGIEVTNSTLAPDWKVSEESFDTLCRFVAALAKDFNLGKLVVDPDADCPNISGHRDWYGASTFCPGDYLYGRLQELADRVNAINYPPAIKAVITYKKYDTPKRYIVAKNPTYLYDFNHTHAENCKPIKTYTNIGEEIRIYGEAINSTIGKTYLITEYTYSKKANTGFIEGEIIEYKEPEPAAAPQPIEAPTEEEISEEDTQYNRGLNDEEYMAIINKTKDSVAVVEDAAKKAGITIQMSNKLYDVLKVIVSVILPTISALYIGLSNIWGFGFGEQVDATIQLVIVAVNAILGLAIVKSSKDYHSN